MRCLKSLTFSTAAALTLAGCQGDAWTAHPDVVAKAAGQELSSERVAHILGSLKGIPVNSEAASFVANIWVDYTLLAQAIADGSLTSDSVAISEAMWVEVAEYTAGRWFERLVDSLAQPSPEVLDSAYQAGSVRVVQHVLIQAQGNAPEAERADARRRIDGILQQARGGADFGSLALAHSGDPSAQADSGFMPPVPPGAYVPAFDSVAWRLEPGEISDVVVTEFGFHVIRRADEQQAKARMVEWLQPELIMSMEAGYYAHLDSLSNIEVDRNAVPRAREALTDLNKARHNDARLASYDGGELKVSDFARWVRARTQDPLQGPQMLAQMQQLPDTNLHAAVIQITQRTLFLRDAQRAGASITAEEWAGIAERFQMGIDTLRNSIGLTDDVIDPNASEADRRRAAALKVDEFFDRMIAGNSRLQLMPGMLTWQLRGEYDHGINPAGVQQAVSLANAAAAGAASTEPMIQPAPGGPPIAPGGQ